MATADTSEVIRTLLVEKAQVLARSAKTEKDSPERFECEVTISLLDFQVEKLRHRLRVREARATAVTVLPFRKVG